MTQPLIYLRAWTVSHDDSEKDSPRTPANNASTEILNTEIFKRSCISIDHDIIPFSSPHKKAPHRTRTPTLSQQKLSAQRSLYRKEIKTESNNERNNITKTVMPQN